MSTQYLALAAFIDTLAGQGVEQIVISPGSRSAPLAILFARSGQFRIWTHLDERSAGFFALGLARASGKPVALLCTSGTAVANYHPAVVEAKYGQVPLLVLTADRPSELWQSGANQTIDQVKIFSSDAKWFAQAPLPEDSESMQLAFRHLAMRAVQHAKRLPEGPVHLNFPFREPLLPLKDAFSHIEPFDARKVSTGFIVPADEEIEYFSQLLKQSERPLIITGPMYNGEDARALAIFADQAGIPVLADVLSQVRNYAHQAPILTYGDWLARFWNSSHLPAPDLIIRVGAPPTSKAIGQTFLANHRVTQVILDPTETYADPFWTSSVWLPVRMSQWIGHSALQDVQKSVVRQHWLHQWLAAEERLGRILTDVMLNMADEANSLYEPLIARTAAEVWKSAIFLGNSTVVRDWNTFSGILQSSCVYGNRGASGIDGLVSSALGIAAIKGRTLLALGDISLYHDLNGLLMAKLEALPLTILLTHNNGGGIFHGLPQAAEEDVFPLFETPHGLDYQSILQTYGGSHQVVSNLRELRQVLMSDHQNHYLNLIVTHSDASASQKWRNELFAQAQQLLEEVREKW
ncbi:2-succinyl-5-enolpyruvyl-6-hydroxy-3-cyclohexene-1-carboxylic-acid synthase [Alicyclobacillus sp. TC]|uniref:2-succinyl-5-enolpyruvyl-6-hydroxy-3-cyclohexene-1-carboxylate synthase n=2 Tax=Alicyclobacillus tolerans TaxID=90970 RepID=A0A1M6JQ41_9BACL|nr:MULTISPECIES: 2-succinyl-5-enolpyruvyl-6-hydroxy-3-cyclohexene-1-carboxylic-acid synthase [Alicyclobacillus]MDP9727432.1 2-succinyl-5-enolpyruvyl-6-hydroxy-3-cyclohexene-1-carboxylate synthase [Alicyclobacillus tengchongensis]QRF23155.1 2-succinyl-5-enolpyruvyl-6-hydroxy-3-cyclohexene-1-carboxylic-acid synthase [Alicyclobacillus sp. TC]SHJ48859.1 2-succinyl-5-enolpyruvyl-6-hydroxy-3-cyclohexene-1-carboxylate synthase [Alicyclobacillus montanus]